MKTRIFFRCLFHKHTHAVPSMPLPDACMYLLRLMHEVKVYHWTTRVFARHESSAKLLDKLGPSVDKFVEMFLASSESKKGGNGGISKLEVREITDATYESVLSEALTTLTTGSVGKVANKQVALGARRDAIVEQLQVGLYLARMV